MREVGVVHETQSVLVEMTRTEWRALIALSHMLPGVSPDYEFGMNVVTSGGDMTSVFDGITSLTSNLRAVRQIREQLDRLERAILSPVATSGQEPGLSQNGTSHG